MKRINIEKPPWPIRCITPDYWAESVADIDFQSIKDIKVVVFDIDSTLTHHKGDKIDADILKVILAAIKNKHIKKVALATNRRRDNFAEIAASLGEDVKYVHAKGVFDSKPFKGYYHRLFTLLDSSPHECLMVGDKIFTDIFGARRTGMLSLHVDKFGGDKLIDKFSLLRIIERWIVKRYHS